MKKLTSAFLILACLSLASQPLSAQMFSVGNTEQRPSVATSFLRFGWAPTDFNYTGNITGPGNLQGLEFNHGAFYLNFESPGFSIGMSLGNKLIGLDNIGYVDINLTLSNQFALIRSPRFFAGVPVQLYSSLTNINNDREEENFNQANFALGGGAFFLARLSRKISFYNEFTPGYGFSSSNGGFVGGYMFYMRGKSRLNIQDVFGGYALSIGYNFNFRSFDVEQELYDFDLTAHTISIGISL
jgi:hypothetical protein